MKNKNNKNSKKVAKKTAKKSLKTVNGIQTLPSGSYRVRRQIDGVMHSGVFKTMRDAQAYKTALNATK